MADMAKIHAEIAERSAAGDALSDRLLAAVAVLPVEAVREIARLVLDENGSFDDHLPQFREGVEPMACSGQTYHYCSFGSQHDPGCPAAGGDGRLTGGFSSAQPCPPGCGPTDAEPWCRAGGFDCASCECVDNLLGLLAKAGA